MHQLIIYRLMESKTHEIVMAKAHKEYAFVVIDPAVASDADKNVWPKRAVLILIGLLLGLLAGIIIDSNPPSGDPSLAR